MPVGRTSGSVPRPEAPAHHLGWVQLVSQSRLLAQAESAAVGEAPLLSSPAARPQLRPSSPQAQGSRGGQGPQGHTACEVPDSPWAREPYVLLGCYCCVR